MKTWGCSPYVTSSLTRGWVCHLQLLLVLASSVILRFESRGTHYILLPQIRESPKPEGPGPRIYIPPEEGGPVITLCQTILIITTRTPRKTPFSIVWNAPLLVRYLAIDVRLLLSSCVTGMCLPTRCLAMGIRVTIFSLLTYLHIPSLVVRLCEPCLQLEQMQFLVYYFPSTSISSLSTLVNRSLHLLTISMVCIIYPSLNLLNV
jgi:hypothetical protein